MTQIRLFIYRLPAATNEQANKQQRIHIHTQQQQQRQRKLQRNYMPNTARELCFTNFRGGGGGARESVSKKQRNVEPVR